MSYQVIARKYRPQRFADVVGQDHVTQTLANAIESGRIAHAYLFCGPRGTGKTTLARIFAKALNCTGGPKAEWDETDPRVQEITEGRALDVLEIDGASNNGVDQVRELRETARFAPASSKFKIYLIDEVHMLSTQAFNALLKTLEEPPAHVKFLFATTDPEKVLPTILSRCQRFDLRRIPAALIAKHLAWICGREKVTIDEAALHAIARSADGGMRDAESTLDQLISFCGQHITEPDVIGMFGLAARAQVVALAEAIIAGRPDTVMRGLDALAKSGKDLGRLLADLLNHFRNLLLFHLSGGDPTLVEVSEAELGALKEQNVRIDPEALTRILEVLSAAEARQREAVSKRIFLEVTLLKAVQARESLSLEAVLRQLKLLRDQEGSAPATTTAPSAAPASRPSVAPAPAASIPTPPPAPKPPAAPITPTAPEKIAPTPAPAAVVPAAAPAPPAPRTSTTPVPTAVVPPALAPPAIGLTTLPEVWSALLASLVGPADTGLRVTLEPCRPKSLFKGLLTIEHPEDVDPGTQRNITTLKAKLEQIGAGKIDLAFELIVGSPARTPAPATVATQPSSTPASTPAPMTRSSATKSAPANPPTPTPTAKPKPAAPMQLNKEDFLGDPLIKEALEIFKGTLLEVRAPEGSPAANPR